MAAKIIHDSGHTFPELSEKYERRTPKMGCLCQIFEDSKFLWLVIFALFLLSCNNGCGCGCGCGCD